MKMKSESERKTSPDRRRFLTAAVLGVAGGVPVIGHTGEKTKPSTSAAKIKGINPPEAPAADVGYTPAILAEGQQLLFISGQGPRDYNADMETQFRQTFERIKAILEQAGGTLANIVILRAYFVHFSRDLQVYRKVRKEFLVKPYPASTAVGVTELAPAGNQIEIEAVAVL
jgi:enamine deaminase RidA (YjgF/YER057c/UK114 family)